jgi:hypothetical protein
VHFLLLERHYELIPHLVEMCPGFRPLWREHRRRRLGQPLPDPYGELALFAGFLVDAQQSGRTEGFPEVFAFLERSLAREDARTAELVVWGLLEDLQQLAREQLAAPDVFVYWLGPRGQAAWEAVATAWSARSPLMETLRTARRGW